MNDAAFSPCSRYRYWLKRELVAWVPPVPRMVAWVMLNPSTADCTVNDPTIRQVMAFSSLWGFDVAEVVNLFAWRATDPRELKTVGMNFVGVNNDWWIWNTLRRADMVMCAWGAAPIAVPRVRAMADILNPWPLHCLGTTKSEMPWHPLYRPHHLRPLPWSAPK